MHSIVPFVRSARRRSSPRQSVLGLSLSRRNEGLGVGSRAAGSRGRQNGSFLESEVALYGAKRRILWLRICIFAA
jgi:hypothetical protein